MPSITHKDEHGIVMRVVQNLHPVRVHRYVSSRVTVMLYHFRCGNRPGGGQREFPHGNVSLPSPLGK